MVQFESQADSLPGKACDAATTLLVAMQPDDLDVGPEDRDAGPEAQSEEEDQVGRGNFICDDALACTRVERHELP